MTTNQGPARPPVSERHGGLLTTYADGTPRVSYALIDRDGAVIKQLDAERVFYAASTVKIGVMIATLREIESGNWSLDDEITVTHEFASVAEGAERFVMEREATDPGLGTPGDVVRRGRVLDRMMSVSANCATNILFEELGAARVKRAFTDAGVYDTCMDRPYSDAAGLEAGISNRSSALGLARLVAALLRGELLDAQHTDYARRLMSNREDPVIAGLAQRLGSQEHPVFIGSKGGEVSGIVHDVAFIERAGDVHILAVCTSGFTSGQGNAVVRTVAEALLL